MKTLVTHVNPHVDDIFAMWLLLRYWPEAENAKIDFVPNEKMGSIKDDPDFIYIGVGRGRFDEHNKGDKPICASTLVFDFLIEEVGLPQEEREALKPLVDYVLITDLGLAHRWEHREFMPPSIINGEFKRSGRDSRASTDLGFAMFDALATSARDLLAIEREWDDRIEFRSKLGKAVAVMSSQREMDIYAYNQGFDIVVIISPAMNYHTVRAYAGSNVDFTALHEALTKREPYAEWYLHQSKKILIAGGQRNPDRTSRTTLNDLIALLS